MRSWLTAAACSNPLPGREPIQKRLLEMAAIGTIGTPQPAGPYYFYTRREGTQNQPVLLVRTGVKGKDRALVDVNTMSTDGTTALDWWFPSEDGKYVAYGISANGSENSTLHIVETASAKTLDDTIDRTRFASLAWKKDNSGFFYSRHPRQGDVPQGEEVYHAKIFYHAMGTDPAKDLLIFGEGRNAQDIPVVALADDNDRWLLITVYEGWAKSELYLKDLTTDAAPVELTTGQEFLYTAEILRDKIYILTNQDASRYRVFVADVASPKRENWKEIIPARRCGTAGPKHLRRQAFRKLRKERHITTSAFQSRGQAAPRNFSSDSRIGIRNRGALGPQGSLFRFHLFHRAAFYLPLRPGQRRDFSLGQSERTHRSRQI